jgi:hypothetical protein
MLFWSWEDYDSIIMLLEAGKQGRSDNDLNTTHDSAG